jgi:hypothetical protein
MSPFVLEIPEHAAKRLKLRKISRNDVRKAIITGELIEVKASGRQIRQLKIGNRMLEVVYLSRPGGFILVTCYWGGEFP